MIELKQYLDENLSSLLPSTNDMYQMAKNTNRQLSKYNEEILSQPMRKVVDLDNINFNNIKDTKLKDTYKKIQSFLDVLGRGIIWDTERNLGNKPSKIKYQFTTIITGDNFNLKNKNSLINNCEEIGLSKDDIEVSRNIANYPTKDWRGWGPGYSFYLVKIKLNNKIQIILRDGRDEYTRPIHNNTIPYYTAEEQVYNMWLANDAADFYERYIKPQLK